MNKVVHVKVSPYDMYIGRRFGGATPHAHFGNPFSHKTGTLASVVLETREAAVNAYRQWLLGEAYEHVEPVRRRWILNNLHLLKDKVLGCYCKPLACHGDVLIELIQSKD
jgi:hypothetical protein